MRACVFLVASLCIETSRFECESSGASVKILLHRTSSGRVVQLVLPASESIPTGVVPHYIGVLQSRLLLPSCPGAFECEKRSFTIHCVSTARKVVKEKCFHFFKILKSETLEHRNDDESTQLFRKRRHA